MFKSMDCDNLRETAQKIIVDTFAPVSSMGETQVHSQSSTHETFELFWWDYFLAGQAAEAWQQTAGGGGAETQEAEETAACVNMARDTQLSLLRVPPGQCGEEH